MPLDPARATFVTREFRYETAEDLAVLATYENAVEIVLDTQLSPATASDLADTMLAELSKLPQVFEVEIEGTMSLEDMDGTLNHYTVDFPSFDATDARTFKLTSVQIDWEANRTKLVIRG